MPLRPIDALFIQAEKRHYVVYYRGELWQLPRMKVDDRSWQRRQPYKGSTEGLYLSRHQSIKDPVLAQKLRTLHLPDAIRGSTLPRFEAWWEAHGYHWLRDKLILGESPLAAQNESLDAPLNQTITVNESTETAMSATQVNPATIPQTKKVSTDIFADMLAELANEVLHQPR